ncbi:hypothetical protein [Metabacillus sp. 84]|uniref:hypothetical protein n=1 Tax=unclassified Metabacillus TaxID=2675274 RepID=UPI003CECF429
MKSLFKGKEIEECSTGRSDYAAAFSFVLSIYGVVDSCCRFAFLRFVDCIHFEKMTSYAYRIVVIFSAGILSICMMNFFLPENILFSQLLLYLSL